MSVVVVCCDEKDQHRAKPTLEQVRTFGKWVGVLIWIALDFDPDPEFVCKWNIQVLRKKAYDMLWLWKIRQQYPFQDTDGRECSKLIQFSKWRVFSPEFKIYKSLLYLDTGMHIQHPIEPIFHIEHKNKILAPDDRFPFDDPSKTFKKQWDQYCMPEKWKELEKYCHDHISPNVLEKRGYFLNCVWLMDTTLIHSETQPELMALAKKFPISRTNEMAIMNLYFLQYWQPFPLLLEDGKTIFDWTERHGKKTNDYILLKYPHFPS